MNKLWPILCLLLAGCHVDLAPSVVPTATVVPTVPLPQVAGAEMLGWDSTLGEEVLAPFCQQDWANGVKAYGKDIFPGQTININAGWTWIPLGSADKINWFPTVKDHEGWAVNRQAGWLYDELANQYRAARK